MAKIPEAERPSVHEFERTDGGWYRIYKKATARRARVVGGLVQHPDNIHGHAWVSRRATVSGDAQLTHKAAVLGHGCARGDVVLADEARVHGQVYGGRVIHKGHVTGTMRDGLVEGTGLVEGHLNNGQVRNDAVLRSGGVCGGGSTLLPGARVAGTVLGGADIAGQVNEGAVVDGDSAIGPRVVLRHGVVVCGRVVIGGQMMLRDIEIYGYGEIVARDGHQASLVGPGQLPLARNCLELGGSLEYRLGRELLLWSGFGGAVLIDRPGRGIHRGGLWARIPHYDTEIVSPSPLYEMTPEHALLVELRPLLLHLGLMEPAEQQPVEQRSPEVEVKPSRRSVGV